MKTFTVIFQLFLIIRYTGKFRAVRDISVAPLDASDQSLIIRMMDEEDGIMAVRKRKNVGGGGGAQGGVAGTGIGLGGRRRSQEALTPLLEAVENVL